MRANRMKMKMKMKSAETFIRQYSALSHYVLLYVAVFVASASNAMAGDNDALSILKSMSDYMSKQATIEFSFDSDIEIITPQLEKIQFTNSGEALLSRPNMLRAHRKGGYADVSLYYDGETASVYSRHDNSFAQVVVPGTIDQLIGVLRAGHGVALPGADFLLSNAYEVLAADIMEAKHIGQGVIGGVECEHLAFRNFDTDWQLWVEIGEQAIPRKIVITSKTINGAPQYTFRVTGWNTDVKPTKEMFNFVPPTDATQLDPNALIHLDELPPEAPSGEHQ